MEKQILRCAQDDAEYMRRVRVLRPPQGYTFASAPTSVPGASANDAGALEEIERVVRARQPARAVEDALGPLVSLLRRRPIQPKRLPRIAGRSAPVLDHD